MLCSVKCYVHIKKSVLNELVHHNFFVVNFLYVNIIIDWDVIVSTLLFKCTVTYKLNLALAPQINCTSITSFISLLTAELYFNYFKYHAKPIYL